MFFILSYLWNSFEISLTCFQIRIKVNYFNDDKTLEDIQEPFHDLVNGKKDLKSARCKKGKR